MAVEHFGGSFRRTELQAVRHELKEPIYRLLLLVVEEIDGGSCEATHPYWDQCQPCNREGGQRHPGGCCGDYDGGRYFYDFGEFGIVSHGRTRPLRLPCCKKPIHRVFPKDYSGRP